MYLWLVAVWSACTQRAAVLEACSKTAWEPGMGPRMHAGSTASPQQPTSLVASDSMGSPVSGSMGRSGFLRRVNGDGAA